jgi:hypothetical protein
MSVDADVGEFPEIIGVFDDRSKAEKAIEDHEATIERDDCDEYRIGLCELNKVYMDTDDTDAG